MNLKKTLEDYLSTQKKLNKIKHELEVAEVKLEMECRRVKNASNTDENLRMLATILLGKLYRGF